jgi:hypothetical protein
VAGGRHAPPGRPVWVRPCRSNRAHSSIAIRVADRELATGWLFARRPTTVRTDCGTIPPLRGINYRQPVPVQRQPAAGRFRCAQAKQLCYVNWPASALVVDTHRTTRSPPCRWRITLILFAHNQTFRRSSSMAEHRFRKAGVEGSNPSFGYSSIERDPPARRFRRQRRAASRRLSLRRFAQQPPPRSLKSVPLVPRL